MEKRLQQALKSGNDTDRQHDNSLLRSILSHMKVEQGLTLQQLINTYAEISPDESIPVAVFAQSLSPSEALCTYLHRQRGLSFHEIALLINRDDRSVWTSCSRAGAKRGILRQLEHEQDKASIRIPTS
ncbi:hypothetical protein KY362_02395, partial [Candidatus Woesearchaeota archaeon]|nr:hypothetical protein [Candidatus Woesearchaeota archaeon]